MLVIMLKSTKIIRTNKHELRTLSVLISVPKSVQSVVPFLLQYLQRVLLPPPRHLPPAQGSAVEVAAFLTNLAIR
jgi:hypothetical protein